MTEIEKMVSGELYDVYGDEVAEMRLKAHDICRQYGQLADDDKRRDVLLHELIPGAGENVYIQGPIYIDYGRFMKIGDNTFINANFVCLDEGPVVIGKNVMIGPDVSIYTAMHSLMYEERNVHLKEDGTMTAIEYAKPVTIGDNCWIAGGVKICAGVTIGSGSVIGAGSIVTKDIPENTIAYGNPCRPIRKITEKDSVLKTTDK